MLVCSPAAVTSQYKIINGWIPFLHRSILLSHIRYLTKNTMFNCIYNNLGDKIESHLSLTSHQTRELNSVTTTSFVMEVPVVYDR